MSDVTGALDQLRVATGETDALAAIAVVWFDDADWSGADPVLVDRAGYLLGVIARSAANAATKVDSVHAAVADAQPVRSGEAFDYSDGTAPGRDAELLKRDAEIVRRLREALAKAFDCPTGYPFFRRDWLPGEDADEALIRIYRSNKQVLDRSDEDIISAIVEHARRLGRA